MLIFDDNRIHIDFGNSATNDDVKIIHNGKPVLGVSRIEVDVKVNSLIEIKLTLHDVIMNNLQGSGKLFIIDPSDGELKRVKNIEFE